MGKGNGREIALPAVFILLAGEGSDQKLAHSPASDIAATGSGFTGET